MARCLPGGRGFTLPELVVVVVLVGVVGVVVVPRFFDRGDFDARGFRDEALAAVRYAHKVAIASGCHIQVRLDASGYMLNRRPGCTSGPFTTAVPHPSRPGEFAASAPGGVTLTPPATFYYDAAGRPRDPGGGLLGATTQVAVGGLALRVEPETGFAYVP